MAGRARRQNRLEGGPVETALAPTGLASPVTSTGARGGEWRERRRPCGTTLPCSPFSPSSCIKTEPHVLPQGSTHGGRVAGGGHAARRWGGVLSTATTRFSYRPPPWFQPLTAGNASPTLGSTGLTTCTFPQSSRQGSRWDAKLRARPPRDQGACKG